MEGWGSLWWPQQQRMLLWWLSSQVWPASQRSSLSVSPLPHPPQGKEGAQLLKATASRLAFLLGRTVQRGMVALAGPCLAALAALPPVEAAELEQLVPALAACQQQPQLAAAVAGVAPALARCPAPHAHVLQALLLQGGPLLQHLGMEAFCRYAQTCPPENVALAVPPAMKDPGGWDSGQGIGGRLASTGRAPTLVGCAAFRACGCSPLLPLAPQPPPAATGALLDSMVSLLTQYMQRSAAGGGGLEEAEVAGCAAA